MTMENGYPYLLLAAAWITYCGLHSALASLGVKTAFAARWPQLMPAYRMGYNLFAIGLLIPLIWLTYQIDGPWLWRWDGLAFVVANGLALLAVAGFIWSLRYYDSQEFLGLRQWRNAEQSPLDQEKFRVSPLHRFVRHPWYSLGLVILWTRDMNPAWLIAIGLATAYIVVGSRLEEQKLLRYHGDVYRRYQERVPGLVPRPWRFLRESDVEKLIDSDNHEAERNPPSSQSAR